MGTTLSFKFKKPLNTNGVEIAKKQYLAKEQVVKFVDPLLMWICITSEL